MLYRRLLFGEDSKDPHWDKVVLMVQPPSSVVTGSTNIIDRKGLNTLYAYGNTQHEIHNGEPCIRFDGNGDYISVPYSDMYNFYAGDFCVEALVSTEVVQNISNTIFYKGADGNVYNATILFYGNAPMYPPYAYFSTSSGAYSLSGVAAPPLNKKYHVALRRYGNTFALYVDGVKVAESTLAISIGVPNSGPCVNIGRYYGPNYAKYYFKGRIYALRVTKGHARYTEDKFNVPSLPWPVIGV